MWQQPHPIHKRNKHGCVAIQIYLQNSRHISFVPWTSLPTINMENQNHLKKFRIKWVKNGMNLQWHFDPGGKNNIKGIKEKERGRIQPMKLRDETFRPNTQPPLLPQALAQALPCVCVCLQGGRTVLSGCCLVSAETDLGFWRFHRWAFHLPLPQLFPLCSCVHSAPSVISITKASICQPLHLPGLSLARLFSQPHPWEAMSLLWAQD